MDKGNPIPTYIKRGLPNLLAAICVALSTTLLVVAWATPNWLQWNTGVTTNSIFDKLGLWVKCNNNRDGNYGQTTYWPGYWETTSSLCVWIIGSSKVSAYLVAIQVLFTISTLILVVMAAFLAVYSCCKRSSIGKKFLMVTTALIFFSAILGTICVTLFGVKVYDWRSYDNYLSWSFHLAVVGLVFQFIAGFLFLNLTRISATVGMGYAVPNGNRNGHR
ncbi:Lens fiber membrane intrinsic protein [Folsomia candida]|uniref:Lens fiber membrane intrinsic protein n=1 Tax=Folsomia candida TaxID=158441 RepID=A0A226DWQ0_FOLCA|nr:Lens fiber membrane intrinsic protein [Folsomia candida]